MKKLLLMMAVMMLLQGCTGMALWTINSSDVKGQDVDEVVQKVRSRGLICGAEYQGRTTLGKVSPYGSIDCGTKGSAPICPASYSVFIVFDLQTRKVLSLTKDERENCF